MKQKLRSKVYIPNRSHHDFSSAKPWGDLIALTSGNLDLSNTSHLIRTMRDIIALSQPTDYILIAGATIANIIACSLFVAQHKKLNLLIYRRDNSYVERNISFEG